MSMMGVGAGMGMGRMRPGSRLIRQGMDPRDNRPVSMALWGRVWRTFAKPYTRYLIALVSILAIGSVLTVIPPRIIGMIVDTLTAAGGIDATATTRITWLALSLVGISVLTAAFNIGQRYVSACIGEGLIRDLRVTLFRHIQQMPIAFFTATQTGALISRINSDVIGAQSAVTGTFGTLVANIVQVVAAIGVMLALNWKLTMIVLVMFPIFIVLAKIVGRRLEGYTRDQMELNATMQTFMTERFGASGALLSKLFGHPDDDANQFAQKADQARDIGIKQAITGRTFFVVLTLMGAIGTALSYLIGGYMAIAGAMTPGEVVAFGVLVTQAYMPLAALSNAPIEVLTALVSFDRVFDILDLPIQLEAPTDPIPLPNPQGRIQFSNVSFGYPPESKESTLDSWGTITLNQPDHLTLHNISFTAEPGQTVALVGPSGAGKSTILSLVNRLWDVTSGSVTIDGIDVRNLSFSTLRHTVGVVNQDPHLFHDTVRANLLLANPTASEADLRTACEMAHIMDVIDALPYGFDTIVGERG
uniref:ABC transporter ATP-binding protein n=1 Tax=Stomatohabitans albus TaxID=3110766 RepID=UPI00300C953F